MAQQQDPLKSTGNCFLNDYKTLDKHPDYTGSIDITNEQIRQLIALSKSGDKVVLKLGMWIYPSKRDPNEDRFFFVVEAPELSGGQQQQQQTRQAPRSAKRPAPQPQRQEPPQSQAPDDFDDDDIPF